jgi:hypothetical protein
LRRKQQLNRKNEEHKGLVACNSAIFAIAAGFGAVCNSDGD